MASCYTFVYLFSLRCTLHWSSVHILYAAAAVGSSVEDVVHGHTRASGRRKAEWIRDSGVYRREEVDDGNSLGGNSDLLSGSDVCVCVRLCMEKRGVKERRRAKGGNRREEVVVDYPKTPPIVYNERRGGRIFFPPSSSGISADSRFYFFWFASLRITRPIAATSAQQVAIN